jgi:hypothetical protein
MLPFENIAEQIRQLENHFADRLAADASNKELATIFIQIKSLKEQLGITCHTQLTVSNTTHECCLMV